jgi:hypothetical protein
VQETCVELTIERTLKTNHCQSQRLVDLPLHDHWRVSKNNDDDDEVEERLTEIDPSESSEEKRVVSIDALPKQKSHPAKKDDIDSHQKYSDKEEVSKCVPERAREKDTRKMTSANGTTDIVSAQEQQPK